MEEGLASLPAQASLPVRPDTGRGACACGASPDSILYTTSLLSELVVYQVPNLKVPPQYANMVRLCLGSVVVRPNQI